MYVRGGCSKLLEYTSSTVSRSSWKTKELCKMPTVLHSIMMILIGRLLFFKGAHLLCRTDVKRRIDLLYLQKDYLRTDNILGS